MSIFGKDKNDETVETTDATAEVATTDEAPATPETETVAETVEEDGLIAWEKPSGAEVQTNGHPANIAAAEANGWTRK